MRSKPNWISLNLKKVTSVVSKRNLLAEQNLKKYFGNPVVLINYCTNFDQAPEPLNHVEQCLLLVILCKLLLFGLCVGIQEEEDSANQLQWCW